MESTVIKETRQKMEKTVEHLKKELGKVRSGRASASLLDDIRVDYYGSQMPITQLATISIPEPRLILIQPWDASSISAIEKAIMKSEIGITPTNDGKVIRLAVPQLTEERRKELIKIAKKICEESKVAIRNERRDAIEKVKTEEKNKSISEDDSKRLQKEIQELTDNYIKKIDEIMALKEKEILVI
ncbi:MAG: ribosome recycling factor [Proteobacteria bacterium]|nr:ribosome recycling factor [Pseudomonadota bacterium]